MTDFRKPGVMTGKWFDRLLIPLIIVLVAAAAFGLGRLSVVSGQERSLTIHPAGEQ
jgi:hypothetical protein